MRLPAGLLSRSATLLFASGPALAATYSLINEYSGETFFDGWDFYGSWDNLTLGTFHFPFSTCDSLSPG